MKTMQLSVLKRIDNLLAGARARAAAAPAAGSVITAGNGGVAAGALTGVTTGQTTVAAFDVTPTRGGLYQVTVTVIYVLSAADTLAWALFAVPAVTAIAGGAAVGAFHYETTGSPLVVTGGAGVEAILNQAEIAAGNITAVTVTLSGVVQVLPTPTRQAIVLTVQTSGGAHLTTIAINNAAASEL